MSVTFVTEGSGVADSVFGKSQEPIKLFIEKHDEAFEKESVIDKIYHMDKSTHWAEKLGGMTSMDDFEPVGENGAYPLSGMQEGFSKVLEHMTWKSEFAISREMVDDAKVMDMRKQPLGFITAYHRTREKFAAALLGGAICKQTSISFKGRTFSTAGADGVCLFDKQHPSKVKASYKQTNLFADEFTADALAAMESKMQDFRDDNGEVLSIVPTTIVIPNDYALKKAVFAAIGADKDPDTANNGANFLFGRWSVIVWQYLNQFITANTKPWILMDGAYNENYGGAVWLDRVPLEVRSTIADNDANVWKGYSRFTAGFSDWRFAAVGGVSGGSELIPSA